MDRRPDSLSWVGEKIFLGMTFREYLKSNLTICNGIAALILIVAIPVMGYRFIHGLGPATNLSDTNPWGIWIGIDMLCGVAFAAGGFVMGTAFYILGLKEYRIFVRPAILTGFLGYLFAVVGLILDLGRYYRLPYPMFVSFGVTSVMFLIAWHVALYLTCQLVEWCPAIFEWLNMKKARKWFYRLAIGATIFGVILSTLHQSALGALFLLAPGKLHPLWYSELIPVFFFASAIIAGISMVIVESSLTHRVFRNQIKHIDHAEFDRLTISLGKACSAVLLTYFALKLIGIAHSNTWDLLLTHYGYWFLFELLGFILLPAFLFAYGVRWRNVRIVRLTALLTVLGIILNRINVCLIAFNWNAAVRYYPSWMEAVITIGIITLEILVFRWIVNRMPILYDHPDYEKLH